jgi:hypothetical protein
VLDIHLDFRLEAETAAPGAAEFADAASRDFRAEPGNTLFGWLFFIAAISCVVPTRLAGVIRRVLDNRLAPFVRAAPDRAPDQILDAGIFPQPPIRRRGHDALHAFIAQRNFPRVALND